MHLCRVCSKWDKNFWSKFQPTCQLCCAAVKQQNLKAPWSVNVVTIRSWNAHVLPRILWLTLCVQLLVYVHVSVQSGKRWIWAHVCFTNWVLPLHTTSASSHSAGILLGPQCRVVTLPGQERRRHSSRYGFTHTGRVRLHYTCEDIHWNNIFCSPDPKTKSNSNPNTIIFKKNNLMLAKLCLLSSCKSFGSHWRSTGQLCQGAARWLQQNRFLVSKEESLSHLVNSWHVAGSSPDSWTDLFCGNVVDNIRIFPF